MAAEQAAAATAMADVEAALQEVDKAAKKQRVCAASSADAVSKMLQVRAARTLCTPMPLPSTAAAVPCAAPALPCRPCSFAGEGTPGRLPLLQAISAARQRLESDAGAQPAAVLAELAAELAGGELLRGVTADTKELHGAVGRLGKARLALCACCARAALAAAGCFSRCRGSA